MGNVRQMKTHERLMLITKAQHDKYVITCDKDLNVTLLSVDLSKTHTFVEIKNEKNLMQNIRNHLLSKSLHFYNAK